MPRLSSPRPPSSSLSCGPNTPQRFASSCSSARSASSVPWLETSRGSAGMQTSWTKLATLSRSSISSGASSKSITGPRLLAGGRAPQSPRRRRSSIPQRGHLSGPARPSAPHKFPRRKDESDERRRVEMENGKGRLGGREVVIVEAVRTPVGRGHPEKGFFKDLHPVELLGAVLHRAVRARRNRPGRGRGRHRRLRPAVRRAAYNITRNAWLAGGPSDETPGDDSRPPVRLGTAGGQFRRGPDRRRRARRRDRRRSRAHGPRPFAPGQITASTARPTAGAARTLRARRAGMRARADRRTMGDPASGARRARAALPAAGPPRHRRGPLRPRDRPGRRSTADLTDQGIRPRRPSKGSPGCRPRSRRTECSPPATPRRSPTAPPPCC